MGLADFLPEILSVTTIAILMAISPGADFLMISKNSLIHGRRAGFFASLGIGLAIWLHVAYSIAGLAVIIASSALLFSIIKYLGAAYLIYIGYQSFKSKNDEAASFGHNQESNSISDIAAFKQGFITNALNPKTTLFFLSIFTQVVSLTTPLWIQVFYGAIISLAHIAWFICVACFLSHPKLVRQFQKHKSKVEKLIGTLLIGLGLKVATSS